MSDGGKWASSSRRASQQRQSKISAAEIKSTLFDTAGDLKLGRKHRPDYFMAILIFVLSKTL